MTAYFNEKTKKWDANFTYRDFENNSRKKMKRGFETEEGALGYFHMQGKDYIKNSKKGLRCLE